VSFCPHEALNELIAFTLCGHPVGIEILPALHSMAAV